MSNFHSFADRTSRKQHQCDECGKMIAVGEKYARCAGSYYGDFYSYKNCSLCDRMWTKAWREFDWMDPEEAPAMGDLRATLADEYGVADPDAWAA